MKIWLSLLAVIVAVVLVLFKKEPVKPSRVGVTRSYILQIYANLGRVDEDIGILTNNSISNEELSKIFKIWTAYPQYSLTNIVDRPRGDVIRDAWGQPFVVEQSAKNQRSGMSNFMVGKEFSIVIWSIGANGKNEFGSGDDIAIR